MTINPLSGIISGSGSQVSRNNSRIQSTIAELVSGSKFSNASSDVSGLSLATQLQSQLGALRQTAGSISQGLSSVQVASDAIDRQQKIIGRISELATQANNGALSADIRKSLNAEAKSLVQEFDRIAQKTNFGNQALLDGTFKISIDQSFGQAESEGGQVLEIPELSASALLGDFDLSTQSEAQAALAALTTTSETLSRVRAEVGSFAQSLDFAGASVESALFNQEAARSTIQDTDFPDAASQLLQLRLQQDASIALRAQANKLPANVLDLLKGAE